MSLNTIQRLNNLVDPETYNESNVGDHIRYEKMLNDHLRGKRGKSTSGFSFNDPSKFDSSKVGLGFTASCPAPLREQIKAQHIYRANENRKSNKSDPTSEESVRVANLVSAFFGVPLNLAYRVTRVFFRTLFAPVTYIYALHQQNNRYNIKDWAWEDLRRVGWEWVDLGVTGLAFFTGLINTLHPNAISLDSLKTYYCDRTDDAISKNQEFAEAKKQYFEQRKRVREQRKAVLQGTTVQGALEASDLEQ